MIVKRLDSFWEVFGRGYVHRDVEIGDRLKGSSRGGYSGGDRKGGDRS